MGELSAQFDAGGHGTGINDASQVPHDGDQLSGGTAPEGASAAPAVEGTEAREPSKPRSGFARQKITLQRLTDLYENLLIDHEQLQDTHERLQGAHDKLEAEYHQLEEAFRRRRSAR
jgi:hypothetical protein